MALHFSDWGPYAAGRYTIIRTWSSTILLPGFGPFFRAGSGITESSMVRRFVRRSRCSMSFLCGGRNANTNASGDTPCGPGNGTVESRRASPVFLPTGLLKHRLDDRSRMTGDCHVRFWESVRARFPCATRLPEGLPYRRGGDTKPERLFQALQRGKDPYGTE
jgi:hypothetical protein